MPARAPKPALHVDLLPLSEIERWPRNPKRHVINQLEDSIDRFGFVAPLIIDETTGRLVAGHGRLDALLAMRDQGAPPPNRVEVRKDGEWLVPVLRGVAFRSEAEAEGYLLADNRHNELGGWDDRLLAEILGDLKDGDALDGVGWSDREVAALLRAVEQPPEETPLGPPEEEPFASQTDRPATVKTLSLYLEEGDYDRVTALLQQIMEDVGLNSHSQAFMFLLDDWQALDVERRQPA